MASKNFKNDKLVIQTPKGAIYERSYTKGANKGKFYFRIDWSPGFGPKMTKQLNNAQCFVDSEVLRLSTPYVPYQTTVLRKSGILGTAIGSGEVCWNAPYAAAQYYNTSEDRSYDSQAGGRWFERMKADHGRQIIAKAKKMGGGNG